MKCVLPAFERGTLGYGAAALACTLLMGACAGFAALGNALPAPVVWDVQAGTAISEADLVARIAPARYRLLGEVHDNPQHHALRARLLSGVARTGREPAVVLEQFDLGYDPALVKAQAAGVDAEGLAGAGELDRRAWAWPLHKPIIEAALAAGLPIHAGNAPRDAFDALIRRDDRSAIAPSLLARLSASRWTEQQARALREDIIEGHCRKLPETLVPRMAVAQRLRDAAMADALSRSATRDGAILIAGNGHVRRDLGVPVYLTTAGAGDVVSVGLIEMMPAQLGAPDAGRTAAATHPGFDYLWLTGAIERADPCAGFAVASPGASPADAPGASKAW